ncbi:MAG: tetratricopeptide repeat protein [Planctomycetes bacterium]|nr:tetratricopeptide repeat protein [Planctomycetota bacterium]
MGPHLDRALLLYGQSRHDLAAGELRLALAEDPHEPTAHALLALCRLEAEDFGDAEAEARAAVSYGPHLNFSHFALGKVLHGRGDLAGAAAATLEAVRLDPEDADGFALLAIIRFEERRWPSALEAADQGLAVDAEHVGCTNLRAMALVKLGRTEEAGRTLDGALARSPEDSFSHANQGWLCLERGDPERALTHFGEAMRLDPTNDHARAGLVEAMKARYRVYGWLLRYLLWMSKLSVRAQWGVVLGGYFGSRLLRGLAQQHPALAPWIDPLLILYLVFALLTWLGDPLFGLLLRLNRFGRLALTEEQTRATNWVGGTVGVALAAGAVWLATAGRASTAAGFLALGAGLLLIPVAAVFSCRAGWPRRSMTGFTTVIAVWGLAGWCGAFLASPGGAAAAVLGVGGPIFLVGVIAAPWVGNALALARPRR